MQPGHVVHAAPWLQVPVHAVRLGGGGGGGGQGGEEWVSSALGRGPGTRAGVLLHLRGSLGLRDLVKENASLYRHLNFPEQKVFCKEWHGLKIPRMCRLFHSFIHPNPPLLIPHGCRLLHDNLLEPLSPGPPPLADPGTALHCPAQAQGTHQL